MVMTLKQGANKESIQTLIEKIGAQKESKGIDAYAYCCI